MLRSICGLAGSESYRASFSSLEAGCHQADCFQRISFSYRGSHVFKCIQYSRASVSALLINNLKNGFWVCPSNRTTSYRASSTALRGTACPT